MQTKLVLAMPTVPYSAVRRSVVVCKSVAVGPYGGPQPRVAAVNASSCEVVRLLGSSSL